jgi:hypothetical protein
MGWLFGLGLVLNIIFLLFCGTIVSGNSRFCLWYNSKLGQLRERVGDLPRLG